MERAAARMARSPRAIVGLLVGLWRRPGGAAHAEELAAEYAALPVAAEGWPLPPRPLRAVPQ
jgi:hypothetical protein